MSDTQTTEKPAKEEESKDEPFNTDKLNQSTARFTRRAWNLFLDHRDNEDFIRNGNIRAKITVKASNDAETVHKYLDEQGVKEITKEGTVIECTTTFWVAQGVIKEDYIEEFDAVRS